MRCISKDIFFMFWVFNLKMVQEMADYILFGTHKNSYLRNELA